MAEKIRDAAGGAYESRGRFYMRVTVAPQKRPAKLLPWCGSLGDATERARIVQAHVNRLRVAGQLDFVEKVVEIGATADPEMLAELARKVEAIVGDHFDRLPSPSTYACLREVLRQWTSGELARDFHDYVDRKRSAADDVSLQRHIADKYLDLPIQSWSVDTYELVMRELSAKLSSARRRHVAQLLHRAFALAVYPLKLLKVSPIPRLPKVRRERLKATLRPEHPRAIAALTGKVDLGYRYLWCFLAETGWRISQATGREEDPGPDGTDDSVPPLLWRDIVWSREVAFLARTKTTAAVEVPLDESTVAGLRAWRDLSPCPGADDHVFVTSTGIPISHDKAATTFRVHLNAAGFTRETDRDLFPEGEEKKGRLTVRVHDLRGLFVSASLAQGKPDTWVMERTLHKTRSMLDEYRTSAPHFRKLGPITPAVVAVPELAAAFTAANAAANGGEGGTRSGNSSKVTDTRPLGGMAYAADLKSAARESVRVRVPQGPRRDRFLSRLSRGSIHRGVVQPPAAHGGTSSPRALSGASPKIVGVSATAGTSRASGAAIVPRIAARSRSPSVPRAFLVAFPRSTASALCSAVIAGFLGAGNPKSFASVLSTPNSARTHALSAPSASLRAASVSPTSCRASASCARRRATFARASRHRW